MLFAEQNPGNTFYQKKVSDARATIERYNSQWRWSFCGILGSSVIYILLFLLIEKIRDGIFLKII